MKAEGNNEERKKRVEDRIKEFQVWMFNSLVQRFPRVGEKVASLRKKGQQPLSKLRRYKKHSSNLADDVNEAHI